MEINELLSAADQLAGQGIQAEVLKWNVITPLDCTLAVESVKKTGALLVAEECAEQGGVGQRALAALEEAEYPPGLRWSTAAQATCPTGRFPC